MCVRNGPALCQEQCAPNRTTQSELQQKQARQSSSHRPASGCGSVCFSQSRMPASSQWFPAREAPQVPPASVSRKSLTECLMNKRSLHNFLFWNLPGWRLDGDSSPRLAKVLVASSLVLREGHASSFRLFVKFTPLAKPLGRAGLADIAHEQCDVGVALRRQTVRGADPLASPASFCGRGQRGTTGPNALGSTGAKARRKVVSEGPVPLCAVVERAAQEFQTCCGKAFANLCRLPCRPRPFAGTSNASRRPSAWHHVDSLGGFPALPAATPAVTAVSHGQ